MRLPGAAALERGDGRAMIRVGVWPMDGEA